MRRDVPCRIHDGANHEDDNAEVLCHAVSAHDAGRLGALNDLGGKGVKLLPESDGPMRSTGHTEQKLLQAPVFRLQLQRLFVEPDDRVPWVGIDECFVGDLSHALQLVLEEKVDQFALLREVAVDGADAESRMAGDVVRRHAESPVGKQLRRRIQNPLAVADDVFALRLRDRAHSENLA